MTVHCKILGSTASDMSRHISYDRSYKKRRCQRDSPLLPRRVPYLELDGGVVEAERLREEGGADGALLVLVELPLDETQHQRGLAHRRLAQQHQLELAHFSLWSTVWPLGRSVSVCCHVLQPKHS